MSSNDPPVVVTGGSVSIKLRKENFPNAPVHEVSDPNLSIQRIVVEDENGNAQTFNFPSGKFKISFYER